MFCLHTLVIVENTDGVTEWVDADNEHFQDANSLSLSVVQHYRDMKELCDEGHIKSFSLDHFTTIHP